MSRGTCKQVIRGTARRKLAAQREIQVRLQGGCNLRSGSALAPAERLPMMDCRLLQKAQLAQRKKPLKVA